MSRATIVEEYFEQVEDARADMSGKSIEELLEMLDTGTAWLQQQAADLVAEMTEGPERTAAQQRLADVMQSRPLIRLVPTDNSMDVSIKPDNSLNPGVPDSD